MLFWWWGGSVVRKWELSPVESDLQLGKPSSPGFWSIICQIKSSD